ncbi:MAG: tryptophanase [candidate division Zixibacteria bacterium]|nr:tryptophanase [candidate division Zixibacteria bacterium]
MKLVEPYRIKTVEPIKLLSPEERESKIREAGFNLFNLRAEDVFIDLLTDSGTSAMSDNQWAGILTGDESYAGAKNFYNFERTIRELFGYKNVIPVHQGRAAEHLFFSCMLKKGDCVVANTHFDTTRANIEYLGAQAIDCGIETDPQEDHPFKGNADPVKLEAAIKKHGADRIRLGLMTVTNNSVGGQPVSMENIAQTKSILDKYKIPLYFDACRFAENAYFIKQREKGYQNKSITQIVKEMFSFGVGCTMSAKKDGLANIGGFFACHGQELAEKFTNLLVLFEGFRTYGGLAGRDLEAISRGLQEVTDENYLNFRISQVAYLGDKISRLGIPIVKPTGGNAVFVEASAFLEHIPREKFPGQALALALYRQGGIRTVEIGGVMWAKTDSATGEKKFPDYDFVRLAIPRRVYTNSHMDYVASSLEEIKEVKSKIRGLKITYQGPWLRHFTARLEEV